MQALSQPALEVLKDLENKVQPKHYYREEVLEELRTAHAIREFSDGKVGITNNGLTMLLKQSPQADGEGEVPPPEKMTKSKKLHDQELVFLRKIAREGRVTPTLPYHHTMIKSLLKSGHIVEEGGSYRLNDAGRSVLGVEEALQEQSPNEEGEASRLSTAPEYPQPAQVEQQIAQLEAESEPLPFDAERVMMAASMRIDDEQGQQDNGVSCDDCEECESKRLLARLMESSPTIRAAVQQMKALDATMQKIWELD